LNGAYLLDDAAAASEPRAVRFSVPDSSAVSHRMKIPSPLQQTHDYQSVPVNSYQPVPVNSYQPVPVNNYQPVPVNSDEPVQLKKSLPH
jgi:hypothetical protein